MSCWPWTNSAYVCIAAFGLVIGISCGRTYEAAPCDFSLICHFTFRIHYIPGKINVHNGRVSIVLVECMMERVTCWLNDPGQAARTFVLLCVSDGI